MKKYLLVFLLVLCVCSAEAGEDFNIVEGGGISGAINKQTRAIIAVKDELKNTTALVPEVLERMEKAAEDRGQIKVYSEENRKRIAKTENTVTTHGSLIVKLDLLLSEVIKKGDESKVWIQGTFFVVLASLLSGAGAVIGFAIVLLIKVLTKRDSSSQDTHCLTTTTES